MSYDPQYNGKVLAMTSTVFCAWQVTVSSATCLVPDWASTTDYKIGEVTTNDGGNVYRCIAPGTSAGSGGPTGQGDDITDGTAHWAFVPGFANGFMVTNTDPATNAFLAQHSAPTTTQASGALLAGQTKVYPCAAPSTFYGVAGSSVVLTIEAGL